MTRKQRRPRIDPSKLDLTTLTGDENVSVINRETGKKITGAKAPPLKYLKEWLEKNPAFDIDGKWAHVVAAKVCFDLICHFVSLVLLTRILKVILVENRTNKQY